MSDDSDGYWMERNTELDRIMRDIHGLYDHFHEYIKEYKCKTDDSGILEVQYTPWEYDLLDADLDFDEEYYHGMMSEFDRFLDVYLKEWSCVGCSGEARLIKDRALFRSCNSNEEVCKMYKRMSLTVDGGDKEGVVEVTTKRRHVVKV
jgi:hypothetical protein